MAKRSALIQQSDATRLLKAARAAGYNRASLRITEGTIEIVGELVEIGDAQSTSSWDEVLLK